MKQNEKRLYLKPDPGKKQLNVSYRTVRRIQWKRIRDKYDAEHPLCELCFERGLAVPVEEIHHKLPLM